MRRAGRGRGRPRLRAGLELGPEEAWRRTGRRGAARREREWQAATTLDLDPGIKRSLGQVYTHAQANLSCLSRGGQRTAILFQPTHGLSGGMASWRQEPGHVPRSPGPGSAPTRMSRPAIGKKSPGEPSANGDRERNPSKQFQDCFLRSRHSATIYPEQFPEQRIVDRAQGPIAPPRPRRRGCRWWRPPARRPPMPCPPAIQQRVRQRHPLAGWPAHTTGLSIHGPHCSLGCYLVFQAHTTHQFDLLH